MRVKILLDAVGSTSIGEEILRDPGARTTASSPGTTRSATTASAASTIARTANRSSSTAASRSPAAPASPTTGTGTRATRASGATCRSGSKGRRSTPLQTGFAQNWLQTTGELISGPLFYPLLEPAGTLAAQTIMSSPEIGASTVRIMYYLSIICARRSIYIANPYFLPDAAAIDALVEAKSRGVDVRVMVSGHPQRQLARAPEQRAPLRPAPHAPGIEILEYNRTMLHHKTMVVDALWATVGTTNFDNRSFAHNEENNVCCYDRAFARAAPRRCSRPTSAAATASTLAAWKRRGLWQRTQEIVAAFLEEQT